MVSTDNVTGQTSGSGAEQQPIALSPNRISYGNGNTTPLTRRSPSSCDSGTECRRLISEGFRVLRLPSAASEGTNSSSLRRSLSLNSTGSSSVSQWEIPTRGVLAPPENLARRSLLPFTENGQSSAAHMLPPPHPLSRTFSDPVHFSNLENSMAMTPVPKTGSYACCGVLGNGLGFDSTQQTSSCKRLKSKILKRNMKQKMMAWINRMPDDEDEHINVSISEAEIIPTDNQVIVDGDVNVNVNVRGYNNGISSADQNTIAIAESEGPQEAQLDNEGIKEEDDDVDSKADLVKARREGDFTFLEFECRCGSSFGVGIIGERCFYKLL